MLATVVLIIARSGVGEIPSQTRSAVNTASAIPPAHDHEGARSGTGMAASRGTGAYIVTSKRRSLNFSYFVARQIWWRRSISLLRGRAHRLQRREPFRGLIVPIDPIFDLLQTARN